MPEDVVGVQPVLPADRGAQPDQPVEQLLRRRLGDVGALVLDADGPPVLARAVRGDHLPVAGEQPVQAAVASLQDVTAAAHREVLPGVGPAVAVHVQVLTVAGELLGVLLGVVRDVRERHVVHDDLVGRDRADRQRVGRRAGGPLVAADDPVEVRARCGVRGGRPGELAADDRDRRGAEAGPQQRTAVQLGVVEVHLASSMARTAPGDVKELQRLRAWWRILPSSRGAPEDKSDVRRPVRLPFLPPE